MLWAPVGPTPCPAFAAGPGNAAGCFRYSDIVTLSGHNALSVLPPADDNARDPRTDAKRQADILFLSKPLRLPDTVSAGVAAALSVQLRCAVPDPEAGAVVLPTGRLPGAHFSNGRTPVLLGCN